MNLAQLRATVTYRTGVPASDAFTTSTIINDFINEGLQAYALEADWPWLQAHETITTAVGTSSYPVAATWNRTNGLYIPGFDPIEWAPALEMDPYTSQGQPRIYTINEEKIDLRPIPDGVYAITHDYQKNEPLLTSDSDVPLLPEAFHYMIVAFASMLVHQRRHEQDRATAEQQNFTSWLRRAKRYNERSNGPIRIRIRPGAAF